MKEITLSGLIDGIKDFFSEALDMIQSGYEAVKTFYDLLYEFDEKIVSMVDNCGTTEFDGLPVVKAISTYRYCVGDVVFYMIYLMVIFGCLFTIYKLLLLIYAQLKKLKESLTGGAVSTSGLTALMSKFIK